MTDYIHLNGPIFAVRFPYAIVTERTVAIATSTLRREMRRDIPNICIRFARETAETSGTMRADSEIIREGYPEEVLLLETGMMPRSMSLRDFILVKVLPQE